MRPRPLDIRTSVTVEGNVTVLGTIDAPGAALGIVHEWDIDGWAPFTPVTISADGSQAFSTTVVAGKGVITGTQPTGGSLRRAYLREGTLWADSEITSLIYGPGAGFNSDAQQGHLHRVREISPGVWEAIAAWTAVLGGGYETLNTRGVRFNGTTLFQSGGDAAVSSDTPAFERRLQIMTKERITAFGLFFNNLGVTPSHLWGLTTGDVVTVDSSDATMDATAEALNGATPGDGIIQMAELTTLATSALAVDRGTVLPSGASFQKRFCPYWLTTRVRGGSASALTLEAKRWRPEDPEPDWGDPRVLRRSITTSVDVPALALGPGLCGLWGAHFINGTTGTYGGATFRQAA